MRTDCVAADRRAIALVPGNQKAAGFVNQPLPLRHLEKSAGFSNAVRNPG